MDNKSQHRDRVHRNLHIESVPLFLKNIRARKNILLVEGTIHKYRCNQDVVKCQIEKRVHFV